MSSTLRRWDPQTREASEWRHFELDPELFVEEGNCSIYLSRKRLDDCTPSFRVPFERLVDAKCQPLVEGATLSLTLPNTRYLVTSPRSLTSAKIKAQQHCSLCLEAPRHCSDLEAVQYHITTRNFFAWVLNKPVVGFDPTTALLALKIRMDAWRPQHEDNFGALYQYAKAKGYGNIGDLQTMLSNHLQGFNTVPDGYKLVAVPSQSQDQDERGRGRRKLSLSHTVHAVRRSLSRKRARSSSSTASRSKPAHGDSIVHQHRRSSDFVMSGAIGVDSGAISIKSLPTNRSLIGLKPESTRRWAWLDTLFSWSKHRDKALLNIAPEPPFKLPDFSGKTVADISSELENDSNWLQNGDRESSRLAALRKLDSAMSSSASLPPIEEASSLAVQVVRARPMLNNSYTQDKRHLGISRPPSPIKEEETDSAPTNQPPLPPRNAARLSWVASSRNGSQISLNGQQAAGSTIEPVISPLAVSASSSSNATATTSTAVTTPDSDTLITQSRVHTADEFSKQRVVDETLSKLETGTNPEPVSTDEIFKDVRSANRRHSWSVEPAAHNHFAAVIDDSRKRQTWYTSPIAQSTPLVKDTSLDVELPQRPAKRVSANLRRQTWTGPESLERARGLVKGNTGTTRFPSLRRARELEPSQPTHTTTMQSFVNTDNTTTNSSPRSLGMHPNKSEPTIASTPEHAPQSTVRLAKSQSQTLLGTTDRNHVHTCRKGHVLPSRRVVHTVNSAPMAKAGPLGLRLDTTSEVISPGSSSNKQPALIGKISDAGNNLSNSPTNITTPVMPLASSDRAAHKITGPTTEISPRRAVNHSNNKSVSIALSPTSTIDSSQVKILKAHDSKESLRQRKAKESRSSLNMRSSNHTASNGGKLPNISIAEFPVMDKILSDIKELTDLATVDAPFEERERSVRFHSLTQEKRPKISVTEKPSYEVHDRSQPTSPNMVRKPTDSPMHSFSSSHSFLRSPILKSARSVVTPPVAAHTLKRSSSIRSTSSTTGSIRNSLRKFSRTIAMSESKAIQDAQASILSFEEYKRFILQASASDDGDWNNFEKRDDTLRPKTPVCELPT